jgi:tripartite-type tricarboxylate transporter receptor subunit TctC
MPGVPTTAEAGVPAFAFGTWIGLVAPAGTPPAVINRLHAEIVRAATQPEVKEAFAKMAMLVATSVSPDAFSKRIQIETERLAKVIRAAGIQPE